MPGSVAKLGAFRAKLVAFSGFSGQEGRVGRGIPLPAREILFELPDLLLELGDAGLGLLSAAPVEQRLLWATRPSAA